MRGYINAFRNQLPQFALANINYRLAGNGQHLFPTQEDDVTSATGFLRNNADSFLISSDKWAIMGESAGGHLALLHAFKMGRSRYRAAIGFGAPVNIEAWYHSGFHPGTQTLLEEVIGGPPTQYLSRYQDASVIRFVNNQLPATQLIHSRADGVVPYSHVVDLSNQLSLAGIYRELITYQTEPHLFPAASLNDVYLRIAGFLNNPLLFR
jgi:acetyl esterase/lipase